jgi:hypothetical protein
LKQALSESAYFKRNYLTCSDTSAEQDVVAPAPIEPAVLISAVVKPKSGEEVARQTTDVKVRVLEL